MVGSAGLQVSSKVLTMSGYSFYQLHDKAIDESSCRVLLRDMARRLNIGRVQWRKGMMLVQVPSQTTYHRLNLITRLFSTRLS